MLRSIALPLAFLSVAACGLAFASGALSQQDAPQDDSAAVKDAAQDDGKLTDEQRQERLHDAMHEIQTNFKTLRKVMRKPEQKAEALAACQSMEAAILTTLQYVPKPQEPLEGAKLLEHDVDFKRRMAGVYMSVLDMQLALEAGDGDRAKELYRALGGQKKEGHDIYIPEEK